MADVVALNLGVVTHSSERLQGGCQIVVGKFILEASYTGIL